MSSISDEERRVREVWKGGAVYAQYQICPKCSEPKYCRGKRKTLTCFECWLKSEDGKRASKLAGWKLGVRGKPKAGQAKKEESNRIPSPSLSSS